MADVMYSELWLDDNTPREAIIAVPLCLAVATVMVGLRIYTRRKQMSMDDWAAIITLVRFPPDKMSESRILMG